MKKKNYEEELSEALDEECDEIEETEEDSLSDIYDPDKEAIEEKD